MYYSLFNALFYKLEDFRLRLHFSYVIQALSHDALMATRTPLEQRNRSTLLERLRHYRNNNVFPRNSYGGSPKPYFFDAEKRACAVADLLIYSDKTELAGKITAWDNNARVKDMHFPELLQWAKKNGISKQDLILIQPQYIELSFEGLPFLILSCANLIFLLICGHQHVKNALFGAGVGLVLFYMAKSL